MFSFPVTKLWGAPSSRFLRGRVRCSLYHGVCRAQGPGSHLRRALPALFYLLVLSAIAISGTARSRDAFVTMLEQTRERYRFVVMGYVVTPERIHLL